MSPLPADYVEMQQKCLVVTGAVFCVIFFVIGVVLWIAVGVVVSNPPDGSKYKSWFKLPFLSSSFHKSMRRVGRVFTMWTKKTNSLTFCNITYNSDRTINAFAALYIQYYGLPELQTL